MTPRMWPLVLAIACATPGPDPFEPGDVQALTGSITWQVDYGDAAEAEGYADCGYTRTYTGIEDRSAPWLCPSCELIFKTTATIEPDGHACYTALTDTETYEGTEWLGWDDDGFRRIRLENFQLQPFGSATVNPSRVTVTHTAEAQLADETLSYTLTMSGAFDRSTVPDADPFHGFIPPEVSACGWERSDRPAYTGPWRLEVGAQVPDGVFVEACDEAVRLHDSLGTWLIVEVSAMDCGPCQAMARGAGAFEQDMADQGVEVHSFTLLAPTLDAVLDPASTAQLQSWTDTWGLTGPVVSERGWGYWLGQDAVPGFGYPLWAVVDPDGIVVDVGTGFGDYSSFATIILENAD